MIKIGILGGIGSGKSYVARNFGYPVFNADLEVSKLYKNDKKIFIKLKKKLSKYIHSFPIKKMKFQKLYWQINQILVKLLKLFILKLEKK